jgi:glucose-6-phosphate isomerase
MSLKEVVKSIVEQIEAETDSASRSNDLLHCPEEAELLAYCENYLPNQEQTKIYKHVSCCNNCIELLAMFAQISEAANGKAEELAYQKIDASDTNVRKLTEKVLEMIEQDELKFNDSSS